DGLHALADGSRAKISRIGAITVDFEPRRLLRTGRPAFDEARHAKSMIFAVDQAAGELHLLVPTDFPKALLERGTVVAAVILILGMGRLNMRDRIGLLGLRYQIAPAQFDTVDAEVSRHNVDQPFQEEVRLESARPAISADRRLVRHPEMRLKLDM